MFAPWIQARADALDDDNGVAMLDADIGRIHMCIGTATPGAIGEGGDQLDLEEVMPSMIGKIVVWIGGHEITIARVMARSVATVEADAAAVLFNGDSKERLSLDLGATEAELFAQLFANVEITLELLGHTLSPLQITALQSAAAEATHAAFSLDLLDGHLLDGMVLPILDLLGSGLTSDGVKTGGLLGLDALADGDDHGHYGSGDDDGDIDADVDTDADVDVTVDEDVAVGVDMDTDIGVHVDTDGDAIDGDIDADVDTDVDVDVDEHGVNADVDAEGDVEVDVGDGMVGFDPHSGARHGLRRSCRAQFLVRARCRRRTTGIGQCL